MTMINLFGVNSLFHDMTSLKFILNTHCEIESSCRKMVLLTSSVKDCHTTQWLGAQ